MLVVPAHAELDGEGNRDRGADGFEDALDLRQVAEQAGAAVAGDDALGRAAEVEVDDVEAGVLDDAGGVGEGLGIGAEELRGDGVLVVVVGEVALALGLAHAGEAVGGGELGHDEAAAGLLVGGLGCRRRWRETKQIPPLRAARHDDTVGGVVNWLAFLMKRRKTVSVTPAMGARTVAGAMVTLPMVKLAGTRACAGIACSAGESHFFCSRV